MVWDKTTGFAYRRLQQTLTCGSAKALVRHELENLFSTFTFKQYLSFNVQ